MPRRVEVTVGESGARVFRETLPDGRVVFLKTHPDAHEELAREAEVIAWLVGRYPAVPKLVSHSPGELVTEALPGTGAEQAGISPEALADAVRQLHSIPVDGCTIDASWQLRLEHARQRVAAGLVNADDFDDAREGRTAEDILRELEQLPTPSSPLCFTHGDLSLENVIVHDGKVSGFIDWGRGGVGHRANDLALCVRSLEDNGGGDDDAERFLAHYGATPGDSRDMYAFLLLDELF